jgi:hypothetical protein
MASVGDGFTYDQFGTILDTVYENIETQLTNLSSEQWNETVTIFGQTGPRNAFLINYLLVFL